MTCQKDCIEYVTKDTHTCKISKRLLDEDGTWTMTRRSISSIAPLSAKLSGNLDFPISQSLSPLNFFSVSMYKTLPLTSSLSRHPNTHIPRQNWVLPSPAGPTISVIDPERIPPPSISSRGSNRVLKHPWGPCFDSNSSFTCSNITQDWTQRVPHTTVDFIYIHTFDGEGDVARATVTITSWTFARGALRISWRSHKVLERKSRTVYTLFFSNISTISNSTPLQRRKSRLCCWSCIACGKRVFKPRQSSVKSQLQPCRQWRFYSVLSLINSYIYIYILNN